MSSRKISDNWYVDFRYNGKRHRLKSPINTKEGARKHEMRLLESLYKGESINKADNSHDLTLKEFYKIWFETYVKANNRYSEIKRKESVFANSLLPFFGSRKLKEITNKQVEEFKASRLKSVSIKTVKNEVSMLRTCLSIAVDWGYLDSMPKIKMPKVPQNGFKWLSKLECDRLLIGAKQQDPSGLLHDMIFLAMKTGLRFGELIALTWEDLDFENRKINVSKSVVLKKCGPTKSGRIRYVPMSNSVYDYYKEKSQTGLLFSEPGNKFIRQKRINHHLGMAYKRAGFATGYGWHTLRHTFASQLACKGASILAIKELLGHTDIKTTMRYAHLSPEIAVDAIKYLD